MLFSEPPPEGGLDLVTITDRVPSNRHLQSPRAGLEAWLGVQITFVRGIFVTVVASTGVLALVPWGFRGLYEAPAIEHKACPSTIGGEPSRAIQHPAVIGLGSLRAPVTVVGEVLVLFF